MFKLIFAAPRKENIRTLVWYEPHETMESAIMRERQLKKWNRKWKLELIEKQNPYWLDLYNSTVRHCIEFSPPPP